MSPTPSSVLVDPWAQLRAPFPPEQVGKLPKAGVTLDFVGHGYVTARLLDVDPGWSWEPMGLTTDGLPATDEFGNLWIRLTILGVTRIGVGDGKSMKEKIGDAIRNGAMRFGVALDLWCKGDASFGLAGHDAPEREQVRVDPDERARLALLSDVTDAALKAGVPLAEIEADWAASHDGQFIGDATDVGSLELIRDDLRSRA